MKRSLVRSLLKTALFAAGCLCAQNQSLLEMADTAFRNGDHAKAAILAKQVLTRQPNAVHAHLILGAIAAQNNDWPASTRHFQSVLRLDPANPFGYFYLGQAKLYQHEWDAAIRYFTQALKRQYPDRERLLVELALAQNEAGRPDHATTTLSGIGAPPTEPGLAAQYYAVTAFTRDKLNQPSLAIEAVREALRLDPDNAQNWEFLIGALLKSDDAPHALAEAIRAQQKFPDNADVQFLFALASYHVTESPLNGVALRNLREAEPGSPRVLLAEGLLHRKQGNVDAATAAFERAAKAGVENANLLLGIVHKENGKYEEAEREFRAAIQASPRNGQAPLELGKLLLTRGELTEARTFLERALATMPDASSVHYQLGLLYARLGQPEKAQEHARKAKQSAGQNP